MNAKDRDMVRELALRYAELANSPAENRKRTNWKDKNSFMLTDPLIYVRAYAWDEMPQSRLETGDEICRELEAFFKAELFRATFEDDYIFEPWYSVRGIYEPGGSGWGVEPAVHYAEDGGEGVKGAYKCDYPIKNLEDIAKMRAPRHLVDEAATAEKLARVRELIGDIITVDLVRGPFCRNWTADISYDLGKLRGMENFMLDMYENPEWLHSLLKFMSEGVMRNQDEAEAAGDIGLTSTYNQAMPYARELQDPAPNTFGVNRKQLWCFTAAQEYALVSPEMHEEFLLRYQLPIMSRFGLVAYGCCEDLTNKITILRKIPNLRRIAVSPFANVRKCAEQIGADYVISYRPSPADMVSYGFDEDRIRKILRRDLEYLKGTYFDITLKDVETVEHDPERIRKWVRLAREIIAETC